MGFRKQCLGIEIVESLVLYSSAVLQKIRTNADYHLPTDPNNIIFEHADAFLHDYSSCDVIFMNCTAWDLSSLQRISVGLAGTKEEAILITSTTRFPDARWTIVERMYLPCSWGSTYFFVHRKRSDFPRFLTLHQSQLEASGVPIHLWGTLHDVSMNIRFFSLVVCHVIVCRSSLGNTSL